MTDKKIQNHTDNPTIQSDTAKHPAAAETAEMETAVTIEETAPKEQALPDTAETPETDSEAADGTIVEKTADTELPAATEATAAEQADEPVISFGEETEQRKWWKRNKTKKAEKPLSERRWVQIRMFPIWLRVLLIIVLMAAAAALGAVVGFSIIGDGTAGDVFKKETWQHIFDIMNGK